MILIANNRRLFKFFKYAMITHVMCHLLNFLTRPFFKPDNFLSIIIGYFAYVSVVAIAVAITIKSLQFFRYQHQYLVKHYKFAAFLIESWIAIAIMALIFLNQEITAKFFNFIMDLSRTAHSHESLILLGAVGLYFITEIHDTLLINYDVIDQTSMQKKIKAQLMMLSFKSMVITGIAVGLIHPIMHLFTAEQLKQFDAIIFDFTKTEFFLYMYSIMTILVAAWVMIASYYGYRYFKNRLK